MKLSLASGENLVYRFFRLAIANILSNILVPLSGLISVAFLGHLGEIRHLAGSVMATLLFNWLYRTLAFLRMGTTGVTAQAVGRDDREAVLLTGMRNGLVALTLGLLILILQYPLRELGFALFSTTPDVKASGVAYFDARIWGAPAALLNFVLIGWFLGREMSGRVLLLSAIANISNIVLDYLFIIRFGWESAGAGLSQASSQYLMLLLGLILVCLDIKWQEVRTAATKLLDLSALKSTLILNGDLFVRTLVVVCTFALFNSLSSTMGTIIFTENALLLQIVLFTIYFIDGLGYATESLTGIFKGEGANQKLVPLVKIAGGSSFTVGLTIALACILFPHTVFGLLTDHTEVTEQMDVYVRWLLLVLGFGSLAFMLEGYYLGLAEGRVLRNMALISIAFGFSPLGVVASSMHNNHLLWLALSCFMVTRMAILGIQLPRTLRSEVEDESVSPQAIENKLTS